MPGDVFLLHKGTYPGPWVIRHSGTPEKPIVWAAAGDGPAVIDGQGSAAERPAHAIEASGTHDVWFEGLTVQNAHHGVTFHDSARIVVRRCHIRLSRLRHERRSRHPRPGPGPFRGGQPDRRSLNLATLQRNRDARGIQITGEGHVVCYNRIRCFADAIDTFPSARCAAIDFHNNDLSELTDDGIELDYSERNTPLLFQPLDQYLPGHIDAAGARRTGLRLPQRDVQRGRRAVQAAQQPFRLPDHAQHAA